MQTGPINLRELSPLSRPSSSRRPVIPREVPAKAWGSVFIEKTLIPRFAGAAPFERLTQLIELAGERGLDSVTVYLEDKNAHQLAEYGILTVNLAGMSAAEMRSAILLANTKGVYLDLHAPWLSGNTGRGSSHEASGKYSYPDPTDNPRVFNNILDFCRLYHEETGKKMELTVHTAGDPNSWASWLRSVGRYATINVENGFIYKPEEQPAGTPYPASSLDYFNASRPYRRAEFSSWLNRLVAAVNDPAVEISALIDTAHAAVAENDPLAYLYFINDALQAGIPIKRLHLASVNLAGKNLGERDNHGPVGDLNYQAVMDEARQTGRYGELAPLIDRIFLFLTRGLQAGLLGITIESKTGLESFSQAA